MKIYLLGAPFGKADVARYTETILGRYGEKGAENALGYAQRIIDRQLNKARGVLTFNALFLNIMGRDGSLFSKTLSVISCLICLGLFFVVWRKDNQVYATFKAETEQSIVVSSCRSKFLTGSILLSIASVGFFYVPTIFSLLLEYLNILS